MGLEYTSGGHLVHPQTQATHGTKGTPNIFVEPVPKNLQLRDSTISLSKLATPVLNCPLQ